MTSIRLENKQQALSTLASKLNGQLLFLIVGTGVSGLNMLHNLLMGRLLNPSDYGQLTFFVTLLMIIGLITTALQTLVSRFAANYTAQQYHGKVTHLMSYANRISLVLGVTIAILLVLFAQPLTELFNISSPILFYIIGVSIPFYLRTGTDRGYLQSIESYAQLSWAYALEGLVRLLGSAVLVYMLLNQNMGLQGAVFALTLSLIMTWWCARPRQQAASKDATGISDKWSQFLGMTLLALIGQAMITNSDFLMVKSYFSSVDAGYYAAISVIGRIVYFGTLPLTIVMTPMLAKQQALGKSTHKLLSLIMGAGLLLCSILVIGAMLFSPQIVTLLYGNSYLAAASLLAPYTIAASLFVLTNLLVTYRIALGKTGETLLPLLAGIAQIIGIMLFHDALTNVIWVQVTVMACLFLATITRIALDKPVE